MTIKVPIPEGGENNLESKFLRAQSGDPEAVKEYRAALEHQPSPWTCPSCKSNQRRVYQAPCELTGHDIWHDNRDPMEAVKEYREALEWRTVGEAEDIIASLIAVLTKCRNYLEMCDCDACANMRSLAEVALRGAQKGEIKAHCMGTEFPKREK